MARLPRLALPGQTHLLVQRAVAAEALVRDDEDRRHWRSALRTSAADHRVAVHAWALLDREFLLLATPADEGALGRMMQALGRRHVGTFNRRHGRRGTLFEGRYRGTVVEPGAWRLDALVWVAAQPSPGGPPAAGSDPLRSSAPHHLGLRRDPTIVELPEFWALGNTPFDREQAFESRLAQGLAAPRAARLLDGALHGWAIGSDAFVAALAAQIARPLVPRARGRRPAGTGNASPVPERAIVEVSPKNRGSKNGS